MSVPDCQLISYIAPAAPATRRPAEGGEPLVRPEVGFTPKWYRARLGIDFGWRWHTKPAYRRDAVLAMRRQLRLSFPGTNIGGIRRPDEPLDLLTGAFGTCSIAAIYGVPIVYAKDNWPWSRHQCLADEDVDNLRPPNLDTNPFFQQLLGQVDWIAGTEARVEGYINWQGVLNNAQRLRGEQLFYDMIDRPDRARRLFDCVCTTMIEAARKLYARQRETGFQVGFFTISNCLVNLVSPEQYEELLLPLDRRIAEAFGCIGVHNCAWSADPYLEHYAKIPAVAYVDMGIDSDLSGARRTFPAARRAIVYPPTEVGNKPIEAVRGDVGKIAHEYAPCDLVLADIEDGTPDERIKAIIALCEQLSR